jgi:hypothetical protein
VGGALGFFIRESLSFGRDEEKFANLSRGALIVSRESNSSGILPMPLNSCLFSDEIKHNQ